MGLKIIEKNKPGSQLLRNKAVIAGAVFVLISVFTAALSAPSLMQTRPELILNSINAFAPHAQISWTWQSLSVLLTLAATLVYAFYMLNKNGLLSIISPFLATTKLYVAILPELVSTLHFCLRVDSSTKKELRSNNYLANLYDCIALFQRLILQSPTNYR